MAKDLISRIKTEHGRTVYVSHCDADAIYASSGAYLDVEDNLSSVLVFLYEHELDELLVALVEVKLRLSRS